MAKTTSPRKPRAARAAAPAPGEPAKVLTFADLVPQPLLFYNVIEPLRPETMSAGGILLAKETQETEELNQQVGILRKRATLSYKTQTPGLDYSQEVNAPKEGDYVFFSKHSGIEVSFVLDKRIPKSDPTNRLDLVFLTDTDILAVFTKDQAERLVGWAQ
jgi:co-chaperonin GroES (HSP10)